MAQLHEHIFLPSDASIQYFKRVVNGRWFNWLAEWRWASSTLGLCDVDRGQRALLMAIEDAVIAFSCAEFQYDDAILKSATVLLPLDDRSVLESVLQECLPWVEAEEAETLAALLIGDLWIWLQVGGVFRIPSYGLLTYDFKKDYPQLQLFREEVL